MSKKQKKHKAKLWPSLPVPPSTAATPATTQVMGGEKCHHEPLPIVVGSKTYYISGGYCGAVRPEYDVYVGLDAAAFAFDITATWPWNKNKNPQVQILYPIKDMGVPHNLEQFNNLLKYIEQELLAGKKVFVGCIGGHGRTGTVLAALVKQMTGNEDAITYVREKYCKKAVESTEQIEFLNKNFGIKKVESSKPIYSYGGVYGDWYGTGSSKNYGTSIRNPIRSVSKGTLLYHQDYIDKLEPGAK